MRPYLCIGGGGSCRDRISAELSSSTALLRMGDSLEECYFTKARVDVEVSIVFTSCSY